MIFGILISLLLIASSIFFKVFRHLPGKGDWIYEYEDETWAKVLIIISRIFLGLVGLMGLICTIFFW